MRLHLQTILDCPANAVWEAVTTVAALQRVAAPLLYFRPVDPDPLPAHWPVRQQIVIKLMLFGVLPFGQHRLLIERVDPTTGEIQSRETGLLTRQWDHLIRVREISCDKTEYSDTLEIDSGWLTWPVWAFAALFYRHRQRQWRRWAAELALAYGEGGKPGR